jgi:uncharacterized protein YndB with AHSA1/START domain
MPSGLRTRTARVFTSRDARQRPARRRAGERPALLVSPSAHAGPEGNSYGFHGVFHGDPSPDAIVQTFEFEGVPGHVCLQTATFADRGPKTLVRTVSAFQSVQDRDAMVASGMERGAHDSGDRLDELLARLQASRP